MFTMRGLIVVLFASAWTASAAAQDASHHSEGEVWHRRAWLDENGWVPPNAVMNARDAIAGLANLETTSGINSMSWTALGPGNFGGRVRSIAPHPSVPNTVFCGSVSGGIWKSLDAGGSWNAIDDFMANLAITSIVFVPVNALIMYAGTGETVQGAGIFKSTDGGATWLQLAATNNSNFYTVNRVSVSADGVTILAATQTGIWRSVNGGSSFTQITTNPSKDVAFHPTNSSVAIAEFRKYDFAAAMYYHAVEFSVNGGATFTEATSSKVFGQLSRIEVAWNKGWTGTGNGCAYALRNTGTGDVVRSLDGGATWTVVATNSVFSTQGWYANTLWVDPSHADAIPANDVLIAGGDSLWRSTNGGLTFTQISQGSASPHADHHCIIEGAGFNGTTNTRIFSGSDGGVWKADNVYTATSSSGWNNLNNGLAITQGYGGSRCPVDGTIEMGTQDNGTLRYTPMGGPNGWTSTFGGDGGACASDPSNPSLSYGEYINAQIFRSTNGGLSAGYIDGKVGSAVKPVPYQLTDAINGNANFIAPIAMDPNASTRLLVGCQRLWRTSDADAPNTPTTGPMWAAIKPPSGSGENISAVAIAASNSNIVWVGHKDGDVYSTANGLSVAPTWTRQDLNAPTLPDRLVTRITIDPSDAFHVFVTFGGFNTDNLWQTIDGGANWTPASGMPAAPLRDVTMAPGNPSWLYVASEVGLLVSDNNGASWTSSTEGPARVSIDELFWSGPFLYAVTFGRGVFRATPYPASVAAVGTGCQSGITPPLGAPPSFFVSTPVIGANCILAVSGAPYPAPGLLFGSLVPPSPTPIGGGCTVYLDLATYTQLGTITTGPGGSGAVTIPIPPGPAYAGAQLATQVVFFPASGGFALTNGAVLTVGY